MNENQNDAQKWDSCPSGEMGRLAGDLRKKRRTHQVKMVAGIAATAVVLLMVGNLAISFNSTPELAGLTCEQVISYAPDYVDHKLDPHLTDQVTLHANRCRHCRSVIAKLREQREQRNVAASVDQNSTPGEFSLIDSPLIVAAR